MFLALVSLTSAAVMAAWVWVSRRKDPRGKPWVTGFYLALLLVLPLLQVLPKFAVHASMPAFGKAVETMEQGSALGGVSHSQGAYLASGLLGVWVLVSAVLLIRIFTTRRALRRWVGESTPADEVWQSCVRKCSLMLEVSKSVPIRQKRGLSSPVVAGVFRPVVLVPAETSNWSAEMREMVVLHELCHVKRRDLWLRLAADVTVAFHWYNPFVWWLSGRLSEQCEYACDADVVAVGVARKNYITALCDVAELSMQKRAMPGALSMAHGASLSQRVGRLLSNTRGSSPWIAVGVSSVMMVSVMAVSLVRPMVEPEIMLPTESPQAYSDEEIEMRHTADPFPGN